MSNKLSKYEKWFNTLRFLEKMIIRPLSPYTQHGLNNKFDHPYIFVCNHYRIWDVIYPVTGCLKPIHYMAKADLWKNFLGKWFANKSQCIPVNRDGNDIKAVMQALKYLKNGENIGIFPEGTRNKSGKDFLEFQSGATALSIRSRVPIIPIVIVSKPKFFHKAHIVYGDPLEFSEYYGKKMTEEDLKACDNLLLNTMKQMREDFLSGAKR